LVEEDDLNDPIADAARSVLDGHIVLSRELAALGHYPAIDLLNSTSRVMMDIVPTRQMELTRRFSEILAVHKRAEDLIHIGAYKPGSNAKIDEAIRMIDPLREYLRQGVNEKVNFKSSVELLHQVMDRRAS
jgi:flagellum-specific ATP synthase